MINQTRYVNIISGVGAGTGVAQRSITLRLLTQNSLVPPNVIFQFSNPDDVGSIFGLTSEEYLRSLQYLPFVSKNITSPKSISFARWVNVAIPAMVVGDSVTKSLAQFIPITAGTLSILSNGVVVPITTISFATAADLTAVATILQTAIRTSTDTQLVTATVTYNTNTNQFILSGATSGTGVLSVVPTGLSTDVSTLVGWTTGGTVLVAGQASDTPLAAITKSVAINNNFATISICTPATPLANTDIASISLWIASQNNNYVYSFATLASNLQTIFPLIKANSGTAIHVLSATQPNDYIEQDPACIAAATDYTAANSTQNFMFNQFPSQNITANDDATANLYDANRANYIGQTQVDGGDLSFYQRGVLCGGTNDATDMNTYYNEIWMKSSISANIFSLLLNSAIVPATPNGSAAILLSIQEIVSNAKTNGVISVGNSLSSVQQQSINNLAGDTNAWRQVQTIGYWLNVTFSSQTNVNSGLVEWFANYILIYAKNNAIRSVTGSDVLI